MALTSRRVALPLLAALLVAGAATAFALGGSRNVEAYSSSTWSAAAKDGKVHVVKFYAPWCGHCKKLAPAWDQLGDAYGKDGRVTIGKMDCTVLKNECGAAEIRGYPTIKAFYNGRELSTHQGQRELAPLKGFVASSLRSAGK